MSEISVYPQGLLSLLGIQSGGQAPRQVTDFLTLNMDVSALYMAAMDSTTSADVPGPLGTGVASIITVPNNQVWILRAAACYIQGPAAGTGRVCLVERGLNNQGTFTVRLTPFVGSATAAAAAFADNVVFVPGQDYVMRPGSQLGLDVNTAITAGAQATIAIKVCILRT